MSRDVPTHKEQEEIGTDPYNRDMGGVPDPPGPYGLFPLIEKNLSAKWKDLGTILSRVQNDH